MGSLLDIPYDIDMVCFLVGVNVVELETEVVFIFKQRMGERRKKDIQYEVPACILVMHVFQHVVPTF